MEQSQIIPVTNSAEIPIVKIEYEHSEDESKERVSSARDRILEQDDEPEIKPQKPKRTKFWSLFLEQHLLLGMICDRHGVLSRAEKLTIILV